MTDVKIVVNLYNNHLKKNALLNINNISVKYGDYKAINSFNALVDTGEIVVLIGQNGSGKSTLLKAISGCLALDSGCIYLNKISIVEDFSIFKKNIGYLADSVQLNNYLTVAESIAFSCSLKGFSKSNDQEVARVIGLVNLEEKVNCPISSLSQDCKKRVAIAQAIIGNPYLLVFDEPTKGLDSAQSILIQDLILKLSKDRIIILSTHLIHEAYYCCSRVLMLNQGRLALDESIKDFGRSSMFIIESNMPYNLFFDLLKEKNIVSITQQQSIKNNTCFIYIYKVRVVSSIDISSRIASFVLSKGFYIYSLKPHQFNFDFSLYSQCFIKKEMEFDYD